MADLKAEALALFSDPVALGHALGYTDLRDDPHGIWIRKFVFATEDTTTQAHRGAYKTTCLILGIALIMIREPDKSIIFLRKTDDDIAEVVNAVQRIILSDVFQQCYYALTGTRLMITKANQAEITLSIFSAPRGSAQLQGIGIGGSLTGKHADIIITDDIVNLKDRISRAEREHTKAIYQELQNIRNRGGRFINTGTPWHPEDAFSLMPEPERWDCHTTGLMTEEQIQRLKKSMAPSLFAANYELRHIPSEGALFVQQPAFTKDPLTLRDGIAHIDAAYGGEDYTAFSCGRRDGNTLYLYGRLWQKHVDLVLPTCIAEAKRLMCSPIMCEKNADKGYLAQEIQRAGARPGTYSETMNKYVKISTYLRKWWGNIVFLEGTDPAYISQIMDFTEDAEHDDAPDSAACIARYYDNRSTEHYASPFGD